MNDRAWQERVAQLPTGHAVALRLHRAGHGDDVIATALGVPTESVPTLLEVARAKFRSSSSSPFRKNQWSTTGDRPDGDP